MEFKITGADDTITSDGTARNAKGGTEMMKAALFEKVDADLLSHFNIICSRVRELSEDKKNILWLHDLWNDPESFHLREQENIDKFDKFVFVSHTQFNAYQMAYNIPYSKSVVLKNAIEPIQGHRKPDGDTINLIYHTTPHRGLELLVPAFEFLYEHYNGKIHLDVYSSFNIYGWPQRDEPYEALFEKCRQHPGIDYHGAVSNDEIRKALMKAHIFAYPCVWPETSCIAAIEAMSSRCAVVHPNFGALPETMANWGISYNWHEDPNVHVNRFVGVLMRVIDQYHNQNHLDKLDFQKMYVDAFYSWQTRAEEWTNLLISMKENG